MEGNENKKLDVKELAEKLAIANDFRRVTVFELMKTIYNFMSECYTTGELREKTRAIKVLADSICVELTEELEGLEP